MTAEFFNQDPDDWKEQIKETPDESLSQETPSVEEETLSETIAGKVPVYCKKCQKLYFLKNLTACLACGSSDTELPVIMHYAEACDKADKDVRFVDCFRIPCQPNAKLTDRSPDYFSPYFDSVNCPKCLSCYGITVNKHGAINNLENKG